LHLSFTSWKQVPPAKPTATTTREEEKAHISIFQIAWHTFQRRLFVTMYYGKLGQLFKLVF